MTAGQAQVNITVRRETHVSHETLLSKIGTLVIGMFASVKMVVEDVSDQHETGYNQGYSEIKQAACFMLMSDTCEIAYRSCKIMSTSTSIPGTLYQGIKTLPKEKATMTDSKNIAALLGPTMIAIGTSEALTFRIFATNIAPLISLNGLLLFVAGLSIVRFHNRWTRDWPVIVTLVGWGFILVGLFRMFAPEVQQAGQNAPTTIITALLVGAIGLFLTFKAYFGREDNKTAVR
jgi:hypothetical protein